MDRDQVIKRIKDVQADLKAEGVLHLALFGSRARGDHKPDSDVDILIDIEPASRFSLLNLVGVEHIVTDRLGVRANAFMARSLDEKFRRSIEADLIEIF